MSKIPQILNNRRMATGAVFGYAVVIISIWSASVQALPQSGELEAKVRQRVSAYMDIMMKGDLAGALEYVHPDSRNIFLQRADTKMTEWQIKNLIFSDDLKKCTVTMQVKVPVAILAQSVEWDLTNEWVEKDSEWYLYVDPKGQSGALSEMFKNAETSPGQQMATTAEPKQPPARSRKSTREAGATLSFRADPSNPSTVHFGEKAVFRYRYKNNTDQPIRIVAAHSDCHCTSIKQDNPDVPPGETGVLEVTLDTFGMPLGPIRKEIAVDFSHRQTPINLQLSTTNAPNYGLDPHTVAFDPVEAGKSAEKSVLFTNLSSRKVTVLTTMNAAAELKVSLDRRVLEPGQSATITLQYSPAAPGQLLDILMLRLDLEAEPIANIKISGSAVQK